MKKQLITTVTVLLISLSAMGQNIIYKGDKQYQATSTWTFKCENYTWTGGLEVQIAKTTTGGYLRLSIDVPDNIFFIGGGAYIFLTDGSTITCSDKGIKDNVDQQSVVLYVFTQAEMDRLKTLDIQKIRFSVKAKSGTYGGPTGNYTANNKKNVINFSIYGKIKEKDYYETSVEVTSLFE